MRERPFRSPKRVPEELILDRHRDAIKGRELVWRAVQHAFGARTVVATDVDDQGVVEFAEVFDGLDNPTDLMIGVGKIRPVDIRLLDEELLFFKTKGIPLRQFFRPRCQLAFSGMMPKRFWLAKMVSRSLFQPSSNKCMALIFSIHSGVG
jgi:hypothetical protein